jgi:hypothetical protein
VLHTPLIHPLFIYNYTSTEVAVIDIYTYEGTNIFSHSHSGIRVFFSFLKVVCDSIENLTRVNKIIITSMQHYVLVDVFFSAAFKFSWLCEILKQQQNVTGRLGNTMLCS